MLLEQKRAEITSVTFGTLDKILLLIYTCVYKGNHV